MPHHPRKRFAQHFLHDSNIIERIISVIDPKPGQQLVEIGPGRGALTLPLLMASQRLDVVEFDRDLIPWLDTLCHGVGALQIHRADALNFDFCALVAKGQRLRVVGNLPYNISTPLLFHLLNQLDCIIDMHFMLQKEVVDRIVASPGGRDYARLSIMLQFRCRAQRLFDVPPDAFYPPPKVMSTVVRLLPHAKAPVQLADHALFQELVTQAFSQRRKTLRNSLKNYLSSQIIESLDIDPGLRPECLSLEQFATLANMAHRLKNRNSSLR